MSNHVLVFGASGSAGWSIVREILSGYSTYGIFDSVTAMINRPLTLAASGWRPKDTPNAARLQIVSGINLTTGTAEEFAATMKTKVSDLHKTTHVIYCAFIQNDNSELEAKMNGEAMKRLTEALDLECPNLKRFVLSEGTRFYHRQCSAENALPAPFEERMTRWCDEKQRKELFYFAMEGTLDAACKGKKWTWCGIIPDAVIAFTPAGSTFALQLLWGTWLSLVRHKRGKGARVYYPGTLDSYNTKFNEVSGTILAHAFIWAALDPNIGNGEIFNIADRSEFSTMTVTFPKLCAYFGLEAAGPPECLEAEDDFVMPSKYFKDNRYLYEREGLKPINIWKADWLDAYGTMYSYDRHMSLDKIRKAGFTEQRDPVEGWYEVFDMMKSANMVPA